MPRTKASKAAAAPPTDPTPEILARLDLRHEYISFGLALDGDTPAADGWISCYAFFREERTPSAGINVITGRYKDHGGDGENISFWEFCTRADPGRFPTWQDARAHFADVVGLSSLLNGRLKPKPRPDDNLRFLPWNDLSVAFWTRHKPPLTPAAVKAFGGRLARYRDQYTVIAIPIWGPKLTAAEPVGWVIWNSTGRELPIYSKGKPEPTSWAKMKTTAGSESGIIGPVDALSAWGDVAMVWKAEGPGDAMAGWELLARAAAADPSFDHQRKTTAFITNSGGSNENPAPWITGLLTDKAARVIHDADQPGQGNPGHPNPGGAIRWTAAIARHATECRNVKLPYDIAPKHGKDLRDWINDGGNYPSLLAMAAAADPAPAVEPKPIESEDDPHRLARVFLREHCWHDATGLQTLRFWRDQWHLWDGKSYQPVSDAELRADLNRSVKSEFDRINLIEQAESPDVRTRSVSTGLIGNTLAALQAQCIVPGTMDAPVWIGQDQQHPWPAGEVFATASGLLHMPTLVDTHDDFSAPPTPAFFSQNAVDYQFSPTAPAPERWLRFLRALWDDDPQSIATLQEWFGYCLLPDTRHHKMLMIVGPIRSGKGTIARILTHLIGERNVASPTLSSLANNFGLWPLLGKTLAVVADARLSGRVDAAAIVERLLSISGEDSQTIDRKNLLPITTRLHTRFVVLSNELPSLKDASGALVSRLVLLRTTESHIGKEDKGLEAALIDELPGILTWAIEGWARLRERGKFEQPESSNELLEELNELSSPVRAFVNDCCAVGHNHSIAPEEIYEAWKEWCKKQNREPGTVVWFGRDLRACVPSIRKTRHQQSGDRFTLYTGITTNKNLEFGGF